MAVVFFTQAPSRAVYEQVSGIIDDGSKPEGLIVHTATEQADGTVKIVDVWESVEANEAFGQKLMGAFAQVGVDPSGGPEPEYLHPFHVI